MASCGIDDEGQIRKLLARYAVAMDAADAEGVAALFAEDGSMEILGSVIAGRAAIAATVRAYDEAGALQGGKHLTLNSLIAVTGDRATARSDWLVVRVEGGGGRSSPPATTTTSSNASTGTGGSAGVSTSSKAPYQVSRTPASTEPGRRP